MCWQELKKTLTELRAEAKEAARQRRPRPPAAKKRRRRGHGRGGSRGGRSAAEPERAKRPAPKRRARGPKPRRTRGSGGPGRDDDDEVEKELEETREALAASRPSTSCREEFAEQKKRYDFLFEQRRDLRESITSTEEAIRKIDEESKTQFGRAWRRSQELPEIFCSLFKGGNAEVKLLEPDNRSRAASRSSPSRGKRSRT